MDISVIIVNWNTKEMLRNCLASIRQCTDSKTMQVIVADNASKDGSAEMVQTSFPEVQLINSGGNIGFGRANNLAISHANSSLLLFLNPDTLIVGDAISTMVSFMETNSDVGALGCKMKSPDGRVQGIGLQWLPSPCTEFFNLLFVSEKSFGRIKRFLPYVDPEQSSYVSKLCGGCLMVRKTVLDKVGNFDERFFMYGEDVDLCKRITDAGWKIYYLSEAEIIHLCGGAGEETSSNFSVLMRCESISKLMQKYYGNRGALLYRLVIFSGSIFRLLILTVLKIASSLSEIGQNINYRNAYSKYIAMFKWSLNLQKPEIKV